MNTTINDNVYDNELGTELENLRGQMRSLRAKLDSQQIISDRLLRRTIQDRTSFSHRMFIIKALVLVPVGVFSYLYLYWELGWPLWFILLTMIFFAVSIVSDWRIQRLSEFDYSDTPLVEMLERLVRQKRLRSRSLLVGSLFLIGWLPLFVYVLAHSSAEGMSPADFEDMLIGMYFGGAIGLVGGLAFGISTYLRMQRENERAIRQLRDYTE